MEDKLWNCIIKRLTGSETDASKIDLDQWLEKDESHARQYQEVSALWTLTGKIKPIQSDHPVPEMIHHLPVRMEVVNKRPFWIYGIAASLVLLLFVAVFFQYRGGGFAREDVKEWIVKKAGPGQMILIEMPDSSKVWLNSDSEIRFLKAFNREDTRSVILNGEAYFEVHHDKTHPFIVRSAELVTTVYGTSFNVRAYGNEKESSVAVSSGKVGVTTLKDGNETRMLLPNDKLTYEGGKFKKAVIATAADGWVRGILIFDQTPMYEVLRTISRKYNVRIQDSKAKIYENCRLTARFDSQPLAAVLKTLKLAMNINSEQRGTTIYLEGGTACNSTTK